jgi:hypothetical protein
MAQDLAADIRVVLRLGIVKTGCRMGALRVYRGGWHSVRHLIGHWTDQPTHRPRGYSYPHRYLAEAVGLGRARDFHVTIIGAQPMQVKMAGVGDGKPG